MSSEHSFENTVIRLPTVPEPLSVTLQSTKGGRIEVTGFGTETGEVYRTVVRPEQPPEILGDEPLQRDLAKGRLTRHSLHVQHESAKGYWYRYNDSDTVLIFVHGIFSDNASCWLARGASEADDVYWPDLIRVDQRFGDPSIYLAGYYTHYDSGQFEIYQAARHVFESLTRVDIQGRPGPFEKKRLIFVCHSTGGIVTRSMLLTEIEAFQKKSVGLLLIASPSSGSVWANIASFAADYYNNEMARQLAVGNGFLDHIHNEFMNLVDRKRLPKMYGREAVETKMVLRDKLPKLVRMFIPNRLAVVKTKSAGKYFGVPKALPDTDHFGTVKPTSLSHVSHAYLHTFFEQFAKFCNEQNSDTKLKTSEAQQDGQQPSVSARPDDSEIRSIIPRRQDMAIVQPPNFAEIERDFIGRQVPLADIASAVSGLLNAFSASGDSETQRQQLIWVHGWGGMGKSWLLRKAHSEALKADARLKVIVVDWDDPASGGLIGSTAICARDLFDVLATRLTQLVQGEAADIYSQGSARVQKAAPDHVRLRETFENLLQLFMRGEHFDSTLVHALRATPGLWTEDIATLRSNVQLHIRERSNMVGLFVLWCKQSHYGARTDDIDAASTPDQVLAASLVQAFTVASRKNPLILILDSLERLSLTPELEHWIRRIVVGISRSRGSVLTLVGCRNPPDRNLALGSKSGWRAEIPRHAVREIPFGASAQFTVEEIEGAIRRKDGPATIDSNTAEQIHQMTRGIPLAFGTIMDLLKRRLVQPTEVLDRYDDELPIENEEMLMEVVSAVAHRFLSYLERDGNSPEDFRDIVAIALLPSAAPDILAQLWGRDRVVPRLRELDSMYALFSQRDLHPEVRQAIVADWRNGNLPGPFREVVTRLGCIVRELLRDQADFNGERFAALVRTRASLASWQFDAEAAGEFARAFSIAMMVTRSPSLITLGATYIRALETGRWQELEPDHLHNLVERRGNGGMVANWLATQIGKDWTPLERACAMLIQAMYCERDSSPLEIVNRIEAAFEYLEGIPIDLGRVRHRYIEQARLVGQSDPDTAERACGWIEKLKLVDRDAWDHDFYWVLHNARRYTEAEQYCRNVILRDPDQIAAYCFLGHILCAHLDQSAQAEQVYREGLERDSNDATLHYFLAQTLVRLKRDADALSEYSLALKSVSMSSDRGRVLAALIGVEARVAPNSESFRPHLDEMVRRKNVLEVDELNSLAWSLYMSSANLDLASELASSGWQRKPDDLHILHTLAAIKCRLNADDGTELASQWLNKVDDAYVPTRWLEFGPLFLDVLKNSRGVELAKKIASGLAPIRLAIRRALFAVEGAPEGSLEPETPLVAELISQFSTNTLRKLSDPLKSAASEQDEATRGRSSNPENARPPAQ